MRFHPDEAFYSTFARNAAVHGRWMLFGHLDKPPLSVYASALSMHFIAARTTDEGIIQVDRLRGEFAARLPGVFASLLLVAIIMRLAQEILKKTYTVLISGVFAATSPYLIVFSATAFTDGLMLTSVMAALLVAIQGNLGWSGVFIAMGFASKQQGLFYVPLILMVMGSQRRLNWQVAQCFILTSLVGILFLLCWDALRPGASIFVLASENYNPGWFFIEFDRLIPRLMTWLSYLKWILGGSLATFIVIIISIYGARRYDAINKAIIAMAIYTTLYLLMHSLLAFNTYDRYLLPIIPIILLIMTWALSHINIRVLQMGMSVLLVIQIGAGLTAARTQINLGSDGYPRDNDILVLADYLNSQSLGAIIYDHWLGWELGYYMGAWSDKRRVYYPEPLAQAEDALLNPDAAPRYFVAPRTENTTLWLGAFKTCGFAVKSHFRTGDYRVYKLIPPWSNLDA